MIILLIKKLIESIMIVVEKICIILLLALITILFFQVFFRYVINFSIPWSEELVRYIFIWNVFIAAGLAVYKKQHIRIEILFDKFSSKIKNAINIIINISICILLSIILYNALVFISRVKMRTTPALEIPVLIPYSAVPAGLIVMLMGFIYWLIRDLEKSIET